MTRTSKALLTTFFLGAVVSVAGAIVLSEGAVHLPARRRFAAHKEIADRIAQASAATWREAQIQAADGIVLKAWEFLPHQWNGATVLVLHGHFDTREGTAGFAPMLLQHGYAVLVPDNRGHGASGGAEVTYGLRERDDVQRWVGWAAAQPLANSAAAPAMVAAKLIVEKNQAPRVYGLGESMGAAILLQSLEISNMTT